MQRVKILNRLVDAGIVAVVRADTGEKAKEYVEGLVAGDIFAIELTYSVPQADSVIADLTKQYADDDRVIVGAGTVLDPTSARLAIIAGAQFIVSPSFSVEVAKICNLYQIPYIPGCQTVTEVQEAMTYGSDIIKVFPGNTLGTGFIKSVHGPLPQASLLPSGGVNFDNMGDWLDAGAVSVSMGSALTKGDTFEEMRDNAKRYSDKFKSLKEG